VRKLGEFQVPAYHRGRLPDGQIAGTESECSACVEKGGHAVGVDEVTSLISATIPHGSPTQKNAS
jgi:hypothetical protein